MSTKTQLAYTYYTMAIYQNSYGMTDRRKPEFRLTVSTVEIEEPVALTSGRLQGESISLAAKLE